LANTCDFVEGFFISRHFISKEWDQRDERESYVAKLRFVQTTQSRTGKNLGMFLFQSGDFEKFINSSWTVLERGWE
jgi:hypothetical protein